MSGICEDNARPPARARAHSSSATQATINEQKSSVRHNTRHRAECWPYRHGERQSKVAPAHDMKAHRGSTGKAPLIHNFSSRRRQVVNITPRSHYRREGTPYSPNRRLGGYQKWPGRFGEEKDLLVPARIQTPDCPARSLITIASFHTPPPSLF